MAQAQVQRKNPSQDRLRLCNNLRKSATNLVEVTKTPALIFFHNPTTKKLEVWGDKFSVDATKNDNDLLTKVDTILSHSVASGHDFELTDLKSLQTSQQEQSLSSCPLPRLQYKMFGEFKKFKENAHLRSSFAKMWRSLAFGTKEMRYGVAGCKPEWFDEEKLVSWSKFKGSARPDGFTGNWAYLQYDIMKACYLHYMSADQIEEYLDRNRETLHIPSTDSIPSCSGVEQELFSVPVIVDNGDNEDVFIQVESVGDTFEMIDPDRIIAQETATEIAQDVATDIPIIEQESIYEGLESEQETTADNSVEQASILAKQNTPKRIELEDPKTPEKEVINYSIPNTPGSLNRKRKFSKAFKIDDIKNKMTKGWLAKVVEEPSLPVFGYLQILGVKKIEVRNELVTLLKASDGLYVTWNVVLDEQKSEDFLGMPTNSVIEVTQADIVQGFRLVIHEYNVVDDEFDHEITLEEELIFLEKSWYMDLFSKKGMVTKTGGRNLEHPHFQTTPIRMMTRSKVAKIASGGVPCGVCGKKFKTEKTMEQHRKRYH